MARCMECGSLEASAQSDLCAKCHEAILNDQRDIDARIDEEQPLRDSVTDGLSPAMYNKRESEEPYGPLDEGDAP